jgi:arginine repressor
MTAEQETIIKAWEETHCPQKKRSRLSEFKILISQKIDEGYTQQSVVDLLVALGCQTTHQNLSRYLKKHDSKGKKAVQFNGDNKAQSSQKSAFSELKQKMRDS